MPICCTYKSQEKHPTLWRHLCVHKQALCCFVRFVSVTMLANANCNRCLTRANSAWVLARRQLRARPQIETFAVLLNKLLPEKLCILMMMPFSPQTGFSGAKMCGQLDHLGRCESEFSW